MYAVDEVTVLAYRAGVLRVRVLLLQVNNISYYCPVKEIDVPSRSHDNKSKDWGKIQEEKCARCESSSTHSFILSPDSVNAHECNVAPNNANRTKTTPNSFPNEIAQKHQLFYLGPS